MLGSGELQGNESRPPHAARARANMCAHKHAATDCLALAGAAHTFIVSLCLLSIYWQ